MHLYLITNNTNGKYYVGLTTWPLDKYLRMNLNRAMRGETKKAYLYSAFRKHGRSAFSIHPLCSTLETLAQLKEMERFCIALFKSNHKQHGYNLTAGGDGITQTPATRKKIGDANRGRRMSDAARQKLSVANRGKTLSAETRRKVSEGQLGSKNHNYGNPMKVEQRAKISEAMRLSWKERKKTL